MRIRDVLVKLGKQGDSTNRAIMDRLLGCANTAMSHPDRLPVTPMKIVVRPSRSAILQNHVANAIVNYGLFARGETTTNDTADLVALEAIAAGHYKNFAACPKEPNSAVFVLRTPAEHRKLVSDWNAKKEAAFNKKVERQIARNEEVNPE